MESPSKSSGDEEFLNSAYWITSRIAVGKYLTPERARHLRNRGITHILNVGENPSIIHPQDFGFSEIVDVPIVDLERIPNEIATACLDEMLAMLRSVPESKVYIHCLAGQNRSPTVLWLFLVACGLDPGQAKHLITDRIYDAVPGHRALVDERLIQTVIEHGKQMGLTIRDAGLNESAP